MENKAKPLICEVGPEYIEREKTVELLRSLGSRDYRREKGTIQDAIKMLSSPEYTPAADVAPVVHAYWVNIVCDGYCREHSGECSHCGERSTFRFPEIAHFCSNCGAKMDLE